MENKLKIKPLTKEQIIISVDRLTRFKPTEEKYLRVFKDLISSNLICPKYRKNDIENLEYSQIVGIINAIFETSLTQLNIDCKSDFSINEKLLEYEKSVFVFDNNVEKLLENRINYDAVIKILGKNIPCNLNWLKHINSESPREEFKTKFPIEKVILAEGITEEILLPLFAKKMGVDFNKEGIMLISAGGKNQVVKAFYQYADILKLPIYVLLDCDAKSNLEEIKPKLRSHDKMFLLSGEFEDLLSLNLIKRTINRRYKNYFSISISDLRMGLPMVKTLEELYREKGLEFKKAEFASLISKNIKSSDITDELSSIISQL